MWVMGIDESLTEEIVRRVLSVSKPDRIIVFGSAAAGRMNRDSDIDLLVVEPAPSNTRFEESKNIFGGLAYPAHKYGRVIYEAA